ncbi:hypothetical protein [Pseudomonas canadensis]|uniref:hypothetical protein n=1 Tax=Pseudomonas canadensis TaxID=915099 RepID=UPI002732C111|nr:hypothetical protein [Pseudomonas canadensis]WLH27456.1 hypothetical protein PSH56_15395 [Pseudomonas canadensis]
MSGEIWGQYFKSKGTTIMAVTPPPPPLSSFDNQEDSAPQGRKLSTILGISPNPVVNNQWFNGQEIKLDGWHFVSCRFDNCRLLLTSTEFSLERCFVDDRTVINYSNELVNVVKLFNFRNDYMRRNFPGFVPDYNIDGTLSVGINKWE